MTKMGAGGRELMNPSLAIFDAVQRLPTCGVGGG
jgi:hypothetical protein